MSAVLLRRLAEAGSAAAVIEGQLKVRGWNDLPLDLQRDIREAESTRAT